MDQVAKRFRTIGLVAALGVLAMVMTLLSAPSAMAADDSASLKEENIDARYVEADSPAEAQEIQKKLDSGVSPQAAGVKYGPCTLKQSNVYIRKSTKGVGAKPVTKCTEKVTSVHHKTQLATRTALLWWKVRSTDTGNNKGEASYTQKNASYTCKSSKNKVWRASTTGTVVSGGHTYYAVDTSGAKKLACGV